MPDRYSDYEPRGSYPRRDYDSAPRRSSSQGRPAPRPQGSRPPQGRPSQRPSSSSGYRRPPQGGGRRPAPRRRRKPNYTPFIIAAVAIIAIVIAIIVITSGNNTDSNKPQATPTPAANSGVTADNAVAGSLAGDFSGVTPEPTAEVQYDSLADALGDEESNVVALDASEQVTTKDLMINTSLPDSWINILLMGTDERTTTENSRTDAMMICSINKNTGEVKLTSIMRDTAFKMAVGSKYDGTYRINAANYFGGPEYAMRVINENLGMNIQYYVTVNFFGFSKIASALGGIDIDITEAEMEHINKNAVQQAWVAYYAGVDESDLAAAGENEYLTTYGPNTHLNGRQTLAYARIRKLDSDAGRTERQRKVLQALAEKLKTKNATELLVLATNMIGNVTTNLTIDQIVQVSVAVLQNESISNIKTLRLPETGSYTQETRNNQSMLYDVDWQRNSNVLYNFIYA